MRNNQVAQESVNSPQENSTTGSWSQSKKWMSEAARETDAYHKLLAGLQRIGADKSPAIPRNPAEFTALKLYIAELKKQKLIEEVQLREAEAAKRNNQDDISTPQLRSLL